MSTVHKVDSKKAGRRQFLKSKMASTPLSMSNDNSSQYGMEISDFRKGSGCISLLDVTP